MFIYNYSQKNNTEKENDALSDISKIKKEH